MSMKKKSRLRFYDLKTITVLQEPRERDNCCRVLGTGSAPGTDTDDVAPSSRPPTMWVLLSLDYRDEEPGAQRRHVTCPKSFRRTS